MRAGLLSAPPSPATAAGSINMPAITAAAQHPRKKRRLQCLDAVRGLNVVLMVFVDNVGDRWESWIDHSPWDVIHLADFVMPLFLFMVGVSMAFSMKKYGEGGRQALLLKVLSRTVKLILLGLFTASTDIFLGGSGVDLKHMRIPGILQRIAWAYCVVAMMKMYLPVLGDAPESRTGSKVQLGLAIFHHYALHWAVAFTFFFVYVGIMLFAFVPSESERLNH